MNFSLRFSEVEAIFAELHGVASDKRVAFQGRIKALLRLGLLPGIMQGRGRTAAYGAGDVYMLGIALELLQLGLTPERAIGVVKDGMLPIASGGRLALSTINEKDPPLLSFLYFDPSALEILSAPDAPDAAIESFFYGGTGVIKEHIEHFGLSLSRLALINVSAVINRVYIWLRRTGRELAVPFIADLSEWLESYPEDRDGDDSEA